KYGSSAWETLGEAVAARIPPAAVSMDISVTTEYTPDLPSDRAMTIQISAPSRRRRCAGRSGVYVMAGSLSAARNDNVCTGNPTLVENLCTTRGRLVNFPGQLV